MHMELLSLPIPQTSDNIECLMNTWLVLNDNQTYELNTLHLHTIYRRLSLRGHPKGLTKGGLLQ